MKALSALGGSPGNAPLTYSCVNNRRINGVIDKGHFNNRRMIWGRVNRYATRQFPLNSTLSTCTTNYRMLPSNRYATRQ
jgi:hypothetical protein